MRRRCTSLAHIVSRIVVSLTGLTMPYTQARRSCHLKRCLASLAHIVSRIAISMSDAVKGLTPLPLRSSVANIVGHIRILFLQQLASQADFASHHCARVWATFTTSACQTNPTSSCGDCDMSRAKRCVSKSHGCVFRGLPL